MSQTVKNNPVSDQEKLYLTTALITGLIIGAAVDGLYFLGPYTGFYELQNPWIVPTIIVTSSLVQIISAALISYVFTKFFIDFSISKPASIPVGILGGALLGGISGGLTIAAIFAIAIPTGAIVFNDPDPFLESWYGTAALGFIGGFIHGMIPGAIAGGLGGPLISFTYNL